MLDCANPGLAVVSSATAIASPQNSNLTLWLLSVQVGGR